MTTHIDTKRLTANDLLRLYSEGIRGELIRGALCQTVPTGQEHGEIVSESRGALLRMFIKSPEARPADGHRTPVSGSSAILIRCENPTLHTSQPRRCLLAHGSLVTQRSFPTW